MKTEHSANASLSGDGCSRRSFLRGTGATAAIAAGALLWGCAPREDQGRGVSESGIPTTWDEEADVVIVGGGGAGTSAALMAAKAGSSVIVLEKSAMTGGSTALCGQAIMGVGTSVQKEAGIEDSVEEAMKYFAEVGDGRDDLVRFVVEHSAEAVEWLIDLGMEVPAVIGNPGLVYGGQEKERADLTAPIMRTHYAVQPDPGLWPVLQKALDAEENVIVRTNTPATALVQHPQTGEVLGVMAGKDGESAIKARKGVVLAAGGYARNPEMMRALISRYEVQTTANEGDTGDGMNLGLSAGCGAGYFGMLSNVQYSKPISPCAFIVLGPDTMEGKPPFICVNMKGERWSNERKFYSYICDDLLKQPEGRAFVLTCGDKGLAGLGKAADQACKADTLADLAVQMGVDAGALASTVEQWNAGCVEGVDAQFGRKSELYPLESGPYYAAEVKPGCASTFGGVTVDTDMHAIAAATGQPIGRLYAAGMNSMALGRFYPTCGAAVATAITTGRQAGTNVAAENTWD
ncbi:hypothetical protein B5F40_13425 [Gordonibacter sp. An230]|uniref:FAD-dependent oxidoreductase n=1 Tax=Gordonibacter sp. An230 TaxID=1965592 RepID=UPI000B395A3E|nr:FAD-dependent oxidoreductase [Gordonibacter sp. An230]OUO87602.1 hypothetical protein B5F40_13425 [Gordonibacter sp. An230]